jgi:hypothetical protein
MPELFRHSDESAGVASIGRLRLLPDSVQIEATISLNPNKYRCSDEQLPGGVLNDAGFFWQQFEGAQAAGKGIIYNMCFHLFANGKFYFGAEVGWICGIDTNGEENFRLLMSVRRMAHLDSSSEQLLGIIQCRK